MNIRVAGVVLLVAVGLGLAVFAFVGNASPYVTVSEAQASNRDGVHLAGDIIPGTLSTDRSTMQVRFQLRDEKGDTTWVRYEGLPPANMGDATKVVAIGKVEGSEFVCRKMLLKCPSKYEGTDKPA
ncbi:MAG: cytochrome c maturation protein CcmE [Fimbriimonadaceae bacterium]